MTTIVLAMHGAPPRDYPKSELIDFFKLHMTLEQGSGGFPQAIYDRHDAIEQEIRQWPRTSENDPFWDASNKLAKELSRVTGYPVVVGFNEFCSPSVEEALENAVSSGADDIIVITPMMTPGGEHSEIDIPLSIERARTSHTNVSFRYVWPFELADVALFLAEQISNH